MMSERSRSLSGATEVELEVIGPYGLEQVLIPPQNEACGLCKKPHETPVKTICECVFCLECIRTHLAEEGDDDKDHNCPACGFCLHFALRQPRTSWLWQEIEMLLSDSGLVGGTPYIGRATILTIPNDRWSGVLRGAFDLLDRGSSRIYQMNVNFEPLQASWYAAVVSNMIWQEHATQYPACEVDSAISMEFRDLVHDFLGLLGNVMEGPQDVAELEEQLLAMLGDLENEGVPWSQTYWMDGFLPPEEQQGQYPLADLTAKLIEGALYPSIAAAVDRRMETVAAVPSATSK